MAAAQRVCAWVQERLGWGCRGQRGPWPGKPPWGSGWVVPVELTLHERAMSAGLDLLYLVLMPKT